MLAHLVAYVGALALLAIVGIHLWDELPPGAAVGPSGEAGWSVALRSHPAFAVSQFDLPEKTKAYEILRHPEGGRKDIFRWMAQEGRRDQQRPAFEPADPCSRLEMNRNWLNYSPAPSSDGAAASHQPHQPRQPTG